MKKLKNYLLMTLIALPFAVGCSSVRKEISFSSPDGHQVKIDQEAWVKEAQGEASKKPAGSTINISDKPVLIEKPGHVGVIVLPAGEKPASVDLQLRPIKTWAGEATKTFADKLVSELLLEINNVQVLLSKGETAKALEKTRQMRNQYPSIAYLKFLEASCLIISGQSAAAKTLLEAALTEHPSNENAQQLYRALAGERSAEP